MKGNNYNTVDELFRNTYRPEDDNGARAIDVDCEPVEGWNDRPARLQAQQEEKPDKPPMIPTTVLGAEAINLDDLHDKLKSQEPLVIRDDGTLGYEDNGDLQEDAKSERKPPVIPGVVVGGEEGEAVADPFEGAPQKGEIPPVCLGASTPTWYEKNPRLLRAEIAAMRRLLGRPVSPYVKPNGQLYWKITLRPNLGHGIPQRAYHLELIYDPEHPKKMFGSSVHALPVAPGPTIEDMTRELSRLPWVTDKRLPHTVIYGGVRYLCTSGKNYVGTDLKEGITTAATAVGYAYRYLMIYEAAIRDPKIWADFEKEGEL